MYHRVNSFPEIRAFIEQDNLLASSTALSLAKLAVEYHMVNKVKSGQILR